MKKWICLLLTLCTVLSLTACGAKPSGSSSGDGEEKITLTMGVRSMANVTDYETNKLTLWLEEVTGYDINIEVYPYSSTDLKTKLAAMMAAGERLPDVFYNSALSRSRSQNYGNDGYLNEVSQFFNDEELMAKLIEKYDWDMMGELEQWGEEEIKYRMKTEVFDANGNLWAFPTIGTDIANQPRNQLFINRKWLDKLGLEMPRTLDELEYVLTEFVTKDPNGNGKADEMGLVGSVAIARGDIPSWLINNFIYLNDVYMFNCDDDGNLYIPYDRDEYREGIKLVRRFYDKNLISPVTWTITSESELPGIFTPVDEVAKIGVWAGHPNLRVTEGNSVLFEYEGLLPLEGSYAAAEPLQISLSHQLGGESEHPKEAFEVLYALATPEGRRRSLYGEPGVDWVWEKCPDECPICGGKGIYGDGLAIKRLYDAYSQQTTSTYGSLPVGGASPWTKYVDDPDDADKPVPEDHLIYEAGGGDQWLEYRNKMRDNHSKGYMAVAEQNNPKNIVYTLVFTDEEREILDTTWNDICNYAKEMRGKFCIGELDVNNDAEWQKYLDTIHSLGWDKMTKYAQIAYDRMYKK